MIAFFILINNPNNLVKTISSAPSKCDGRRYWSLINIIIKKETTRQVLSVQVVKSTLYRIGCDKKTGEKKPDCWAKKQVCEQEATHSQQDPYTMIGACGVHGGNMQRILPSLK